MLQGMYVLQRNQWRILTYKQHTNVFLSTPVGCV
jgi:hypothetical protein